MKICCNIIRDLLPLYIDKVESEESRAAIKEHMKVCPDCRRYYKSIIRTLNIEKKAVRDANSHIISDDYKKISRKIKQRRGAYTGAAALTLLLFSAYSIYMLIKDRRQ